MSEIDHRGVRVPIHVQRIESALQTRIVSLGRRDGSSSRALVLLGDGAARLAAADETRNLEGPVLSWFARPAGHRLSLEAGTTGYVAEIADETIARAVGDFAESATLMFMVDRDLALPFNLSDPLLNQLGGHLGLVCDEIARPRIGSMMQIVAHLRIVLVLMMRVANLDVMTGSATGKDAHVLQRFRQLVEGNFRDHWPVGRYAQALRITHDRLHAICRRELARTPKALIAERLAREAGLALERSTLSVEQVSDALGFRDPAHFSHFFKKMTGIAPGRFRKLAAFGSAGADEFSPPSFADWP